MNQQLKAGLVVVGAIGVSSLAINASDLVRGLDGSLVGLVQQPGGICGSDATVLQLGDRAVCIDTYEASPAEDCALQEVSTALDTQQNLADGACTTVSEEDRQPWRYVSVTQAQQLCARTGKRLPSNEEWYKAVLGITNVESCAIGLEQSGLQPTGAVDCRTPSGIADMIGNVWEWVDGEVQDGVYAERQLPIQGYVSLVDTNGVVLETSEDPVGEYGDDYAWTNDTGVKGMIRGGFYGSESDAGLFTINAAVDLDFKTAGVGFRCVKDV